MKEKRIAQEKACGLLSLPDEILAWIAHTTQPHHVKEWAKAASTCKRLSELQCLSGAEITKCRSEAPHPAPSHLAHKKRESCHSNDNSVGTPLHFQLHLL